MKKQVFISTVLLLVVLPVFSSHRRWITIVDDPHTQVDSIIEYRWDTVSGDWFRDNSWINPELQTYIYHDNLLSSVLVTDKHTGDTLRRELFSYASGGLTELHIYQNYHSGKWINIRKDSIGYSSEGLTSLFLLQLWKNNQWTRIYRFTDYRYDRNDLLISYLEQQWKNNLWQDYTLEYYYYDDAGLLTMRLNRFVDGTNRFRFLYDFDPVSLISEWIHQPWKEGAWAMGVKQKTWLNSCGQVVSQVRMNWNADKDTWINYSLKEYYRSLVILPEWRNVRIPVCHKGKTRFLPVQAVNAHIRHGDCIGDCQYSGTVRRRKCHDAKDYSGNKKSELSPEQGAAPLNVPKFYPNPFREYLTVRLPHDNTFRMLQIMDLSGRILKTYRLNGQQTLRIERSDLKSGIYFLRLTGEDIIVEKIMAE